MRKSFLHVIIAGAVAALPLAAQMASQTTPKRVNRAIAMLEKGQPVYYTGARGGAGYDEGKKMAQTKSDYINYEMEHGSFDTTALREFMRGLVDGGPTPDGYRTPTVIVTLPVLGLDETSMKANYWVVQQVLATGVHGILLCHARSPEAVRVMVEAARYPFAEKATGLGEGFRGSGSQGYAAQIWGLSPTEYLKRADPWPLNKNGEIMLGLKIEDKYALANAERLTKMPGIAFAEWGPGDMGWSLVGLQEGGDGEGGGQQRATNSADRMATQPRQAREFPPVMLEARTRVLKATKEARIAFLNSCNNSNVVDMIKEGVMICTGGYEVGRPFTKNDTLK